MSEHVARLKEGAFACLKNANCLLEDAENLFAKKSYRSCFLLTQLAMEELAKGFKLANAHLKNKKLSKEEWEELTKGRKAHLNKLKYLHETEDKWTAEATRMLKPELDYLKLISMIAKDLPWAGNIDKYRQKLSETHYNWRLESLYVDYDWEKKQWIDPKTHPIFNGTLIDEVICQADMKRTEHLVGVLLEKLSEQRWVRKLTQR